MVCDACRSGPPDLEIGALNAVGYLGCRCCRDGTRCRRWRRSDQETLLVVALGCCRGALRFYDDSWETLLIVTSDRFEITSCS